MDLKISRILHAGYLFESSGAQIAFDPIFENPFSRNCHAFPNVEFDFDQVRKLKLDAVFISHYHDDHCSLESLDFLNRQTPIFVFSVHEEIFSWIRGLGFQNVHSISLDSVIRVGPFQVTARRALDEDVDSLFQIEVAGLKILNVVDSWIGPETMALLARQAPWDLVLWPFQTLRELEVLSPTRMSFGPPEIPVEWIEQLQVLTPRYLVPSSCQFKMEDWSWYNQVFFPISYQFFQSEMRKALPEAQILRMDPSVSFEFHHRNLQKSDPLPWVKALSGSNTDYSYQPHFRPPMTSEIAKSFPNLASEGRELVLQYLRKGILEKFRSLEPAQATFFQTPRLWRLKIFDQKGSEMSFHYLLHGSSIEMVPSSSLPIAWQTEVCLWKLHAALAEGESLTSLYIRINDCAFDADVEAQLKDIDPLLDPLIRCLFEGVFGSYQAFQFARLQSRPISPVAPAEKILMAQAAPLDR